MKLPNFIMALIPGTKDKLKKEKAQQFLINEFEAGRVLHVDDGIDNKEILSKKVIEEELHEIDEKPNVEREDLNSKPYTKSKIIEGESTEIGEEENNLEELPEIEPKKEEIE